VLLEYTFLYINVKKCFAFLNSATQPRILQLIIKRIQKTFSVLRFPVNRKKALILFRNNLESSNIRFWEFNFRYFWTIFNLKNQKFKSFDIQLAPQKLLKLGLITWFLDKPDPAIRSTPPCAAQKGVDKVREAPLTGNEAAEAKASWRDEGGDIWSDEPWVLSPKEFSAPPLTPGALSVSQVQTGDEGSTPAVPGCLGKAVGSVHESPKYWKDTFEEDSYVMSILENGYKIPVNMSDIERIED
jgi:hypothetical protein